MIQAETGRGVAGLQAYDEPEALEEVAHKAIKDAALSFNPLPVGYEDALRLLKTAY